MSVIRNTVIKLYKNVKLDRSSEDTFYFDTKEEQSAYFNSKIFQTIPGSYYQRDHSNVIRVELPISGCFNVEYLSFLNVDYENKLYYAFVTRVNYINDNVTEFEYEIDYIQTWLFEFKNNLNASFVERCHSSTDTLGDNTLLDNLDCGELVNNGDVVDMTDFRELSVVVQSTCDLDYWLTTGTKVAPTPINRNGLYDGTSIIYMPVSKYISGELRYASSGSAFGVFMGRLYSADDPLTQDDILSMWLYPTKLLASNENARAVGTQEYFNELYIKPYNASFESSAYSVNTVFNQLDGYLPANNKLRTYPYSQVYITNNNGSGTSYRPERFSTLRQIKFKIVGTTTGEAKCRLLPIRYKGLLDDEFDYDEALDSASFPSVSASGDSYSIYLAQNRNVINNNFDNMERNLLKDTINYAVGNASGAAGGIGSAVGAGASAISMTVGYVNQISGINAQLEDLRVRPNTAIGVQSTGINAQNEKNLFSIIFKTVDNNHAKLIDNFWTMFGYPQRKIMYLNLNARTRFTYIKTVGMKVPGVIPTSDKELIEDRFNNGIRFWVDHDGFGDYAAQNTIYT